MKRSRTRSAKKTMRVIRQTMSKRKARKREARPRATIDHAGRRAMTGKAGERKTAAVGVTEHGNSAVLVTIATGGEFLDRRALT